MTYKCLKSTILHEILSFSLRLLRTLLTLKYIHEFLAMIKCLELKMSESDVDGRRFLNILEIVIASYHRAFYFYGVLWKLLLFCINIVLFL